MNTKYTGVAIIYKNGTKDWFDPVLDESTEDGILKITIENGYTYDVVVADIESKTYY